MDSRIIIINREISSISNQTALQGIHSGEWFLVKDENILYWKNSTTGDFEPISNDGKVPNVTTLADITAIEEIQAGRMFVVSDTRLIYWKNPTTNKIEQVGGNETKEISTIKDTLNINKLPNNSFFITTDTSVLYRKNNAGKTERLTVDTTQLEATDAKILNAIKTIKSNSIESGLDVSKDIAVPGTYPLTGGELVFLTGVGNYNLTLPTDTSLVVRVKPTVEGITYTVTNKTSTVLTSSDDVLFYWNKESLKWEYVLGEGIYIYLAVTALHEVENNIEDFFTNRNQQATSDRIEISTTENIKTIKELINRIRLVEAKLGTSNDAANNMNWLMDSWTRTSQDEFLRGNGGSGVFNVRNYSNDTGFNPKYRPFDVSYAAMTMHTHSNFYNTLGLGEIAAIINGYLVRTTHNDPWLTYSVKDAKGIDGIAVSGKVDFTGAALPPALPPAIAARPTGVTFNDVTNNTEYTFETSEGGLTQAEFFRNMFSNNDYLKECRWDLSYLEIAIEKIGTGGRLFNYVNSARHGQTGNTLQMLLMRATYMASAGLKNTSEDDSFRSGFTVIDDEQGNPVFAHINYRMRVKSVGTPAYNDGRFSLNDSPPIIIIGETNGTQGLHPHFFDGERYTNTAKTWQAIPLTITQANEAVDTPNTRIRLTTSIDHDHAHIIEVWYTGSQWLVEDVSVLSSSGDEIPTGHKHPVKIYLPTSNLPFDLYKATHNIIDNKNKFVLVRDVAQLERLPPKSTWLDLALSNMARFRLADGILEELCESCFGFDGEGSFLEDTMALPLSASYNLHSKGTAAPLNAAKYNREYTMGLADASNRGSAPRGFNDPTLFVAKTSNTNIVTGYTYMIPLEMVLRTPFENWNPYDVEVFPSRDTTIEYTQYLRATKTTPNPRASFFGGYFIAPNGLYNTSGGTADAADTGGNVWMRTKSGAVVKTEANGIPITKTLSNPSGSFVYKDNLGADLSNTVRFRYPVYPVYYEYTHANVQLENFKVILKRALKDMVTNTLTDTKIDDLF